MTNIVLIGMPGCGKSTCGVLLAKTLGMGFMDTDLMIQLRQNAPLQTLLDRYGTQRFREFEEDALILSAAAENTVIATGGSAVFCEKGMAALKKAESAFTSRLPAKSSNGGSPILRPAESRRQRE